MSEKIKKSAEITPEKAENPKTKERKTAAKTSNVSKAKSAEAKPKSARKTTAKVSSKKISVPTRADELHDMIADRLERNFGRNFSAANNDTVYLATATAVRELLAEHYMITRSRIEEKDAKTVCYLSMEFLIGRSLPINMHYLGITDAVREALDREGFHLDEVFEIERDAGLGNGGLGRLAACYMESLASLGYPAEGYSILYEFGIFRQKIIDGTQVELPDEWLGTGNVWLTPKLDETVEVRFGGTLDRHWESDRLYVNNPGATVVRAVPYDMYIPGADTDTVVPLRLWKAESPRKIDMALFSSGEYLRSMEEKAMAESISKILYPEDNHPEGKSLRLRQQYFFVSATVQSVIRRHLAKYGTLDNFADKVAMHINDTHPTVVIPELMRILMDEYGYSWEDAWRITSSCCAYTNHTVMGEALERWSEEMFRSLLPRLYEIVQEINRRFCERLWEYYPGDWDKISRMAVVASGEIRMANLCLAACFSVNGVSALHSDILKDRVFADFYRVFPKKFTNVTNGIAHRRWLERSNPGLASLLKDTIGDGYRSNPDELEKFRKFENDAAVLDRLAEIKRENKARVSNLIASMGVLVDPDSIFDVQVKRLHEYKRQLLNVLNIIRRMNDIRNGIDLDQPPRTFIFGAKASAGYYMAKQIIRLICSLQSEINTDPLLSKYLRVVFIEDYNVSKAEIIVPAADVSEQISVAGREASGTGNMKFMMNGAVTIGTLDGANVEICEAVGRDNIFIFGLTSDQTASLASSGTYNPMTHYQNDRDLRHALNLLTVGIGTGELRHTYSEIYNSLVMGGGQGDIYMVLADFADYHRAQNDLSSAFTDRRRWEKMSLVNIAMSGRFSADRSVKEYAERIWGISPLR